MKTKNYEYDIGYDEEYIDLEYCLVQNDISEYELELLRQVQPNYKIEIKGED